MLSIPGSRPRCAAAAGYGPAPTCYVPSPAIAAFTRLAEARPPGRPSIWFDTACVLGGSIAGLLAARVLADHARSVVVIERDAVNAEGRSRAGVPQDRQVHVLLPGAALAGALAAPADTLTGWPEASSTVRSGKKILDLPNGGGCCAQHASGVRVAKPGRVGKLARLDLSSPWSVGASDATSEVITSGAVPPRR
jgi:hypothetical protein